MGLLSGHDNPTGYHDLATIGAHTLQERIIQAEYTNYKKQQKL